MALPGLKPATLSARGRMMNNKRCEHYECRCRRAAELMAMSDAEPNPQIAGQLAHDALQAHSQKVPCRNNANCDQHRR